MELLFLGTCLFDTIGEGVLLFEMGYAEGEKPYKLGTTRENVYQTVFVRKFVLCVVVCGILLTQRDLRASTLPPFARSSEHPLQLTKLSKLCIASQRSMCNLNPSYRQSCGRSH